MDSEQNDQSQPPSSHDRAAAWPPPGPVYYPAPAPRRRGWRVLLSVLFGLSLLAGIVLFFLFLGAIAMIARGTGPDQRMVLREGARDRKIVVIPITGIIDTRQAEEFHRHIQAARRDASVKGLIIRIDSPGGTVSGSDRIYKEIMDYRKEKDQPAVALQQSMATSGGYYASVACDEIIAEPTTITGSIGVVLVHFVLEGLLEDKLGIQPVFQTMGEKKDWPSMFRTPTQEEFAYVRERLLEPAYRRFVGIVKEGRAKVLPPDEVDKVADGSIFAADQALEAKLVDKIGYLEDAIAAVETLAGIDRAQVVEYRRPLSLFGLLSAKGPQIPQLNSMTLIELGTPQMLYLWNAYQR